MELLSPAGVKVSVSDELGEQLVSQGGYKRRGNGSAASPQPAPAAAPASQPKSSRRARHKDAENAPEGHNAE